MAQQPPPAPLWAEHLGEAVTAIGLAWGAVHGVFVAGRRWMRRRERRRELESARDQALRVLLDGAREALRDDGDGDVIEIRERVARRRTLLDSARDRLWLAQGRQRSAALPSDVAPPDEDDAA